MTYDPSAHDIAKIRELLSEVFTPEGLRRFCVERPTFQPILPRFGAGHGFPGMIDHVIENCQKQGRLGELLTEVQRVNPRQYARFLEPDLPIREIEKPREKKPDEPIPYRLLTTPSGPVDSLKQDTGTPDLDALLEGLRAELALEPKLEQDTGTRGLDAARAAVQIWLAPEPKPSKVRHFIRIILAEENETEARLAEEYANQCLDAIRDVQHMIDDIKGRARRVVNLLGITRNSPATITIECPEDVARIVLILTPLILQLHAGIVDEIVLLKPKIENVVAEGLSLSAEQVAAHSEELGAALETLIRRLAPAQGPGRIDNVSVQQIRYIENTEAIRGLIMAAFSPGGLRRFCYDDTALRPVIDTLSERPSLAEMADQLIEYCEKWDRFGYLLAKIERYNPGQYNRYRHLLEPNSERGLRASY